MGTGHTGIGVVFGVSLTKDKSVADDERPKSCMCWLCVNNQIDTQFVASEVESVFVWGCVCVLLCVPL